MGVYGKEIWAAFYCNVHLHIQQPHLHFSLSPSLASLLHGQDQDPTRLPAVPGGPSTPASARGCLCRILSLPRLFQSIRLNGECTLREFSNRINCSEQQCFPNQHATDATVTRTTIRRDSPNFNSLERFPFQPNH